MAKIEGIQIKNLVLMKSAIYAGSMALKKFVLKAQRGILNLQSLTVKISKIPLAIE